MAMVALAALLAAVHFEYIFEVYGKDGELQMQQLLPFQKLEL